MNFARLFLDSLILGIFAATALFAAIILFDGGGMGQVLLNLGNGTFALVWISFAVAAAPFGTLSLLWRIGRD